MSTLTAGRGSRSPSTIPITYIVLACLACFSIGPLVLSLFTALKTPSQFAEHPLGLPPTWEWGNFVNAWTQGGMQTGLINSVIVVGGTVIGVLIIAGCGAYALARLKLPGGNAYIAYLIVSTTLPTQMFLVPLFYMWARAGLYDTRIGLILIYCGLFSPFATLLLRSFLISLPPDLEEAARIDGASELGILFRIILPIAKPGLLTIAIITALSAYNEFLFALTFIQSGDKTPLSTTFFAFQIGFTDDYTLISAAGMIMLAPMLILFLALQRRFIEGVASSGMGGA